MPTARLFPRSSRRTPICVSTISGGGALNGPLGVAIAPNGNILTTNAGDGNMVETTPAGVQVAVKAVDVTGMGGGTFFGLAIRAEEKGLDTVVIVQGVRGGPVLGAAEAEPHTP